MSLIRIGESLHCHIPSVRDSARRWLSGDALDREASRRHLTTLVQTQVAAGADYLDVNVDDFLAEEGIGREGTLELLSHILNLIDEYGRGIPPCIDSSDPAILEWGLADYYRRSRDRAAPLLNSVTVNRLDTLELRRRFPFAVIGMLLERAGDATGFTDIAGPEVYHETASAIFDKARAAGFTADEVYFDPTVGPLGADMVGFTKRTFEGIRIIRSDAGMKGVHVCLGLSNCSDGLPRRLAVNRAYLRIAMEYGVDAAICDAGQISGTDLVDGKILRLIRKIATGEATDPLTLLVDFAQGHPKSSPPARRAPLDDAFGAALAARGGKPALLLEMAPVETNVDQILTMAEEARDTPFSFAITDTPSGNRTPGPDTIALEVGRIMGRQPIVNLSCKSADRNGLIQRALGLYHQGLRHFFAVTGDYPASGRPCFDLDSVNLLLTLNCLRRGLDYPSLMPRPRGRLDGIVTGAAISPFKYSEADVWGQYLKLGKKRAAGAGYFITQLGYDVRKFQELKLYMRRAGMGDAPVLGMVYYMTPQVLKVLSRVHVAGVVIPEDLKRKYQDRLVPATERKRLQRLSFAELAEHQRAISVRRAALLIDILTRGLDYRGIDLAGAPDVATAVEIVELAAQLQSRDWRESYAEFRAGDGDRELQLSPEDAFYLFPEGGDGLLDDDAFQRGDRSGYVPASSAMRRLHQFFFEAHRGLNGLLKWGFDGTPDSGTARLLTLAEQALKSVSLGCEMCGDCRIADLQFMCPEPTRGCSKRLLNGPCAGSDINGMCEVDSERRCYWGRVIEAALRDGGLGDLARIQPPKDPQLQHTSSWRSEVLGLCPPVLELFSPPADATPGDGARFLVAEEGR
jgi:methylenetetrahydrofolate reductase (NADPH)